MRLKIGFGIGLLGPDLFGIWFGLPRTWVWCEKLGISSGIPAVLHFPSQTDQQERIDVFPQEFRKSFT